MTIILILVLLFLLFDTALVASTETALFSLSSVTLKSYERSKDSRKITIYKLLASPRNLLVTFIILMTLFNILVQNVVATLLGKSSAWILNVGVPLALTLIVGEVIPKSIGLANNEKISYRAAPFLFALQRFFRPIVQGFIWVTSWISHIMFFFLKKEEEISIDELQHALRASREYGALSVDEAELARGYLNLKESSVKALMRPREEVLFFDMDEPLAKLVHLFVDQECSRIPICQGGLDKIIGIMTGRLFFLHKPTLHEAVDLLSILKKPVFVPETMDAIDLLKQMYRNEESLAIVVDEYGSINGIIALEDLVEVVVGEISDRRDVKNLYTRAGEDVIITSGKLELTEFAEIFNAELESKNGMVTIGGWLTEQLGDIPKTGAKYMTKEFLFQVLSADPNRVRRVYIRRLHPKKRS